MAKNPRFNNSGMFTDASEDYSEITPNNKSEVLATQGNVINSIRVFWNKLKEKLAFAITRADYNKQVGGNYVPIFVNTDGVVQECQPTTIQADIAQNGIITISTNDIPNDNIYTGTTVCISVLNNRVSDVNSNLQIQHNNSTSPVKYPSGVTVLAGGISKGDLLLATFCKNSTTSSNNNFWILLNKINTVVSTAVEGGGHPGLMTAADKAKLDTIETSANNYSLPAATDKTLGGIQLGYTTNETNETNRNYKLQTDTNGNGYVNVPWTVYSLPIADKDTLGGVKSKDTGTTDGKDYNVQINSDGTMKVNVPWTDTDTHNIAYLRAGNNTSTDNDVTTNNNTYLKIVDGGRKTSSLKISGSGDTTVTSDNDGNITINSPKVNSYSKLDSSNNNPSLGYLIKGSNSRSTNKFLAGNGAWVEGRLVPNNGSNGQILKWGTQGPYWGNAD